MKKIISIVLNNFKNDSRVLKESISLQNAGYDIKVIALHEEPLEEFDEIQNIPIHRIKLRSRSWPKHKIVQVLKYIEFVFKVVKLYKNNDIFHCNDLNALPVGVLIKCFFNREVKVVYDAHEYETEISGLGAIEKKLTKWLEKLLIRYVDKTMTVSDAIANEYVRLYNIQKPALVLNTSPYKKIEKKDIFRKTFDISSEQTIFLYQGGLSKGRGIEILLETFKLLWEEAKQEEKCPVIVFMGYGMLEGEIKKQSLKYKNIYFHQAVGINVLLDYTCSADFGFSTIEDTCLSYRYCLPNKMFEYIMAEIPVIVSNLYEMKKLVEINKIGVVAKENTINGLKDAIVEAIKIDKEKVKVNIKKIKNVYNWEEQEKILLELYKKLYEK